MIVCITDVFIKTGLFVAESIKYIMTAHSSLVKNKPTWLLPEELKFE